MSQLFSGKDNYIGYQQFVADAKYRVPTMQIVWGLIQPLFKKPFYHQGFFTVKRRAVFILGAKRLYSKAVFHVFVFDSIHDSASPMPDPTPHKFSRIIFVNKTTI